MRIRLGFAKGLGTGAAVSVATPSSQTAETNPPDPKRDRPSRVVVAVSDGGFHCTDAGVGRQRCSPRHWWGSACCLPATGSRR